MEQHVSLHRDRVDQIVINAFVFYFYNLTITPQGRRLRTSSLTKKNFLFVVSAITVKVHMRLHIIFAQSYLNSFRKR